MRISPAIALILGLILISSLVDSRRFGGGSRGGSSRSGGVFGFGRRSSSSRTSSSRASSYPKQQWGTNTGGSQSSGGSNSYPKQQWGGNSGGNYPKQQYGSNSGSNYGSNNNYGSNSRGSIGGGGFVNPRAGSYGSYGSAGAAGAFGAGAAKPQYSYKAPGYGTSYGTSFPGGVGKYGSGLSKKKLGLGVGAGFLGGAAIGAAAGIATMSVYHRYWQYKQLLYMHQYGNYNNDYYNNNYVGGRCFGGCPINSFCQFGFCECQEGFQRRYGRCWRPEDDWRQARISDPFSEVCRDTNDCQKMDMNLICNTNKTIQQGGRCECREDMRWNTQAGECQLFLDVDCSAITYDTKPSQVVLNAVNATLEKVEAKENSTTTLSTTESTTTTTTTTTESTTTTVASTEATSEGDNSTTAVDSRTASTTVSTTTLPPLDSKIVEENQKKINETLENSLLSSIDPKKASENEIREAYCRDVDTFSWEFAEPQRLRGRGSGTALHPVMVTLAVPIAALFMMRRDFL